MVKVQEEQKASFFNHDEKGIMKASEWMNDIVSNNLPLNYKNLSRRYHKKTHPISLKFGIKIGFDWD